MELRVGINTGEALITFQAPEADGETTATGDVVNTAARLETAAPVNGILVGSGTYEATAHVIEYRAAPPVRAKGKRRPVPAWEALRVRSEIGAGRPHATPLVGRERELEELQAALDGVAATRSLRLITLLGSPGLGHRRKYRQESTDRGTVDQGVDGAIEA